MLTTPNLEFEKRFIHLSSDKSLKAVSNVHLVVHIDLHRTFTLSSIEKRIETDNIRAG